MSIPLFHLLYFTMHIKQKVSTPFSCFPPETLNTSRQHEHGDYRSIVFTSR